jgi:hypothetical protein
VFQQSGTTVATYVSLCWTKQAGKNIDLAELENTAKKAKFVVSPSPMKTSSLFGKSMVGRLRLPTLTAYPPKS